MLPSNTLNNETSIQVSMGKSKSPSSHQVFKDKAKNRVDDLQGMFTDLQHARQERRTMDVALLEQRVNEMLSEWKAELNTPSPASSQNNCSSGSFANHLCSLLQQHSEEKDDATSALAQQPGSQNPDPDPSSNVENLFSENALNFQENCSLSSFSSDLRRFLQHDENDDATSALAHPLSPKPEPAPAPEPASAPAPEPEPTFDIQSLGAEILGNFHEDFFVSKAPDEHGGYPPNKQYFQQNTLESSNQQGFHQFDFSNNEFIGFDATGHCVEGDTYDFSGLQPSICPPSAATLGPKCALWDCSRPTQGSDHSADYCSSFHANLGWNEGLPGMAPIVRPGGIGVKDDLLFAALGMKMQGKEVGIPECEGAATKKSPWSAPELFDVVFVEGEKIREWLFFDKHKKAFNSGNRKQRSLPDYKGRGWHASRKQAKEQGRSKRSYYMDPQPFDNLEWHLYEYEIDQPDAVTLCRLELKLVDEKKSPKGKVNKDSLTDLQKQMGRLSSDSPIDSQPSH